MKKNYIAPTVDLYEYSVEDTLLVSGGMMRFFQDQKEDTFDFGDAPTSWLNN